MNSSNLSSQQLALKGSIKMDNIIMTRPLFDKPNTALIKLRRDIKMQKLKQSLNQIKSPVMMKRSSSLSLAMLSASSEPLASRSQILSSTMVIQASSPEIRAP